MVPAAIFELLVHSLGKDVAITGNCFEPENSGKERMKPRNKFEEGTSGNSVALQRSFIKNKNIRV